MPQKSAIGSIAGAARRPALELVLQHQSVVPLVSRLAPSAESPRYAPAAPRRGSRHCNRGLQVVDPCPQIRVDIGRLAEH